MRKLSLLIIALMFLAGCGSDLPPSPPMPGQAYGVGGAITGAMPNWAAPPVNALLTPSEATYGDGIIATVSDYDYVYQNGYIFNSQ